MLKCSTAYVRGEKVDIPRFGEIECVGNGQCDRVRFFAGRASGTPQTKGARIFPKLLHVKFGKDLGLHRMKDVGIAEKRGFLREQLFEQTLVFHIRRLEDAK